VREGKCQ